MLKITEDIDNKLNNTLIETERLKLRNLKEKDINILHRYRNDIKCSKYQRWENTTKEYLENFIKEEKYKTLDCNSLQLAIANKEDDKLIGDIYIAFKDKCITIGYTIDSYQHRKGYAYEILKKLIGYLFNKYKDYEIVGLVHPENEPSKKLLEKLDFNNEGYIEKIDSIVYSLKNNK